MLIFAGGVGRVTVSLLETVTIFSVFSKKWVNSNVSPNLHFHRSCLQCLGHDSKCVNYYWHDLYTYFQKLFQFQSEVHVFFPVFFRLYYSFIWHDHIYDLEHSLLFLHEYFTRSFCPGVIVGLDSRILQCFTLNRLESFRFVLIPWIARIYDIYIISNVSLSLSFLSL